MCRYSSDVLGDGQSGIRQRRWAGGEVTVRVESELVGRACSRVTTRSPRSCRCNGRRNGDKASDSSTPAHAFPLPAAPAQPHHLLAPSTQPGRSLSTCRRSLSCPNLYDQQQERLAPRAIPSHQQPILTAKSLFLSPHSVQRQVVAGAWLLLLAPNPPRPSPQLAYRRAKALATKIVDRTAVAGQSRQQSEHRRRVLAIRRIRS